jgi:hypothetical protein
MKIRRGFVSNSSSSSFICNTNYKTDKKYTLEEISDKVHKIFDFGKENGLIPEYQNFDDVFQEPQKIDAGDMETMDYFGTNCKIGDIVVYSAGDNSIPYELFDVLEVALNSNRNHLG